MKNLLLFVTVLFLSLNLQAQPWLPSLEKEAEKKGELTFFDIQKSVNDYYSTDNFNKGYYYVDGNKIKAPGWKQFKRWEWYWDARVNTKTGEFPKTTTAIEWKEYLKKHPDAKSVSGNWQPLGPDQSGGGYAGIGRINCISFHPTDTNTYWVGAPSGGLWKTTDDGQTWTVLTDQNDVLGVSDIAIPSDFETSNTIYIATGDRDGGSVWTLGGGQYYDNHTIGVLKSTDGGTTWNETALSYTVDKTWIIGRLLIDTTDNITLFASTYTGIYKTTNGGTSWTKILTADYVIDMEFKPGDPSTIYVSTKYSNRSKIYRSTNGGDNWSELINFGSGSRRTEIAVTDDDPDYIYALVSNTSGGLFGIYKSRDGGGSFELTLDGDDSNNSLLYYYSDGSGSNTGQGNYDLAIAVAPNDTNIVFIGGINSWKSEDGGYTWNINNMWTSHTDYNFHGTIPVHADKHVLKYRDTLALFEGNDGGIYKTNDEGENWDDLTNEMVISQFYRLGVSQQSSNMTIGGLQDNGTKLLYTDGNWYDVKGGDGMECIIDPTDDNYQYGTYVDGEIERTTDGWSSGTNRTIISDNIADADGGWWVSPYMLDPNNTQIIYVGYNDVWKSTDRGDNFTKISTMNSSGDLRSMAMSPANSDILYVADQNNIWKTENGGSSWTDITGTLPSSNAITYLYVDHNDANTVWITFGGYDSNRVYESTNGGSSWTDISSGLPDLPVFSIIQNKLSSAKHLYVAMDIGVFVKEDNSDWQMFSTGLPNVLVTELDIYYDESTPDQSKIRAATFGRGLWESDLFDFELAEIQLNSISGTYYVSEDSTAIINISYDINETFSSNTFTAYLSDETGDFSSESAIGDLDSDVAGTIEGTIPINTPSGTGYKVRVKSSNPPYTSSVSNSFEIVLDNTIPTVSISSTVSGTTSANPFDVNIIFSEKVYGFEETDITVSNATISDFDDSAAPEYVVEIAPTASGTVTVDVPENSAIDTVGHGNTAATQWLVTYTPTGIEMFKEYGINIFPNPSTGKFTIEIENSYSAIDVSVIDLSGRIIYNELFNNDNLKEIDLSGFAKGIYILQLNIDHEKLTTKILIE